MMEQKSALQVPESYPRLQNDNCIPRRRRLLSITSAGLENLARYIQTALAVAMIAQVVLVTTNIVGRTLFQWAPAWLEEIAGYLFIWVVMLGTALTVRDGSILTIDVVAKRLRRATRGLRLFADLLTLTFFALLTVEGWNLLQEANAIASPGSNLSLGYAFGGVFIGGLCALLFRLEGTLKAITFRLQELLSLTAFALCVSLYFVLPRGRLLGSGQVFIVLFTILIVALLVGVPVAVAIGLAAILAIGFEGSTPMVIVAQRFADGLNNLVLLAIPFFLLAGALMARSSLASRLITLARACVGRRRAGLASADIIASVVFADMSGSAIADTAALGTVVIPELKKVGYSPSRAAALQASAGALGIMFPPSVTMIIYASVANVSVAKAFLSVILPGIILTVTYLAVAYVIARRDGIDNADGRPMRERLTDVGQGLPVLIIPVIILGGIFAGLATPAEAGTLAVIAALTLSALVFRDVTLRSIGLALVDGSLTVARVGFIIAAASALAWTVTAFNGPQIILVQLASVSSKPVVVLLLLGVALVLLHTVMDAAATMLVITPLFMPLLVSMNIDLLHFGVLLDVTSVAGLIIPPIGFNLYIASHIAGVPMERAAKAALPYLAATMVVTALVIVVPGLSTWLPRLISH